uniref:EF-hand domain-containing protein n=1 Tax=Oryza barthii TaxID=65489 RepID=A0A0D3F214_9ORYZ
MSPTCHPPPRAVGPAPRTASSLRAPNQRCCFQRHFLVFHPPIHSPDPLPIHTRERASLADPPPSRASSPRHFGALSGTGKGKWLLSPYKIALFAEMGGVVGRGDSPRHTSPASKLERKMVEAMQQRAQKGTSVKSFNSVIMKFPKIDESLRNCRIIFQQFDEDSNGEIDQQELKHCFQKLDISFTDEEIKDLFQACDIYENMGMKFNEFIVFLCLVYLLNDPLVSEARKRMGLGSLEPTFETLVDSFVFLDKNKDGYVSKNEMIQAINETIGGERSSGRIGMKRFEEMDWDKNGTVTFKEFLFAFTRWVGIDDNEDDDDEEGV